MSEQSTVEVGRRQRLLETAAPWLVGVVLALLVLGPGTAPGSLLNLDLVLVPEPPVPRGVWSLGPDLPRRVPMWVFMSWASAVLDGALVGKLVLVGCLAAAFVGMVRLVRGFEAPPVCAWGAGVLYAFGPFLLTRAAVGHWMVLVTMAMLPWALKDLLEPDRSLRRTLIWSAAFGVAGVYGGVTAGLVIAVGLVARRAHRALAVVGVFLVAQLPWLVPMVVVTATTGASDLATAESFRTPARSVGDLARVFAGGGFWNRLLEVGHRQSVLFAVIGVVLAAAAFFGARDLPAGARRPLGALAAISMGITLASGLALTGPAMDWFTNTPLGAPFRDTQRNLALFVLWMAPAASLGAARLARSVGPAVGASVRVLPLALGLVLLSPAVWGIGGQLEPMEFPTEWDAAKHVVDAEPGTLVAFPWYEYFTLDIADDRLVLNVVPYWFGGDVISSSDPGLRRGEEKERPDAREVAVEQLSVAARDGEPISAGLARLGVRWVALQHDVDWRQYTGLASDTGLERVVDGPSLTLYRVTAWPGQVWADGSTVPSQSRLSPWWSVDGSGAATMAGPAQDGWLRGWSTVGQTDDGLLALPSGEGPVWYWPTLPTLAAYGVTAAACLAALIRWPRRRV